MEKTKAKISYVHDKGLFYSRIASFIWTVIIFGTPTSLQIKHSVASPSLLRVLFLFGEFWHCSQKIFEFFFNEISSKNLLIKKVKKIAKLSKPQN
jgi:hypothetical protein